MVEHHNGIVGVAGSNPVGSTSLRSERSGERRLPRRSAKHAGGLCPTTKALRASARQASKDRVRCSSSMFTFSKARLNRKRSTPESPRICVNDCRSTMKEEFHTHPSSGLGKSRPPLLLQTATGHPRLRNISKQDQGGHLRKNICEYSFRLASRQESGEAFGSFQSVLVV